MSEEPAAKKARTEKPVLYSYWRSSCSYRVRIALAYKGVEYDYEAVNLLKSEQVSEEHKKRNVMGQVPAFLVGDSLMAQSLAILEYLEEKYPEKPLLPKGLVERAQVRELCNIISSGIQPIQNLGVLKKVAADFGDEHKMPWGKYWIEKGFEALEAALSKTAGKFCFGDSLTLADCCLVPQVYNATRFSVDLTKFPTISRLSATLDEEEVVKAASPASMPDAVKA